MTTATNVQVDGTETTDEIIDRIDDRLITVERSLNVMAEQLEEIHGFCARLATTLDALSGNPMVAAMLPPGAFGD